MDAKVYVRKSIEKKFAIRTHDVCCLRVLSMPILTIHMLYRQQCSPQFERDILLRAATTKSHWAPHLLCAFQTDTHLNLVMQYAEGGTLWDVLESSPLDGRVSEDDLHWWIPQVVSAIDWCHSQDFVHRYLHNCITACMADNVKGISSPTISSSMHKVASFLLILVRLLPSFPKASMEANAYQRSTRLCHVGPATIYLRRSFDVTKKPWLHLKWLTVPVRLPAPETMSQVAMVAKLIGGVSARCCMK
jgi:serine/threonine protein kinase